MRTWYEFRNSAGKEKETEIFLYDQIGGFGISAAQFIAELQQVPKENRLVLRIHSPGGSVLDGNAIFTALRAWPAGCTTHIDGLAASMASVIAIVGDPVQMAGNGIMMIHRVSAGAHGNADDLRKMAEVADKIEETIIAAFVGRTGLSRKRVAELMDAETWMTASEALELGFIDEITGELALAAEFDLSHFKNCAQLTELQSAMKQPTIAELQARVAELEPFQAQVTELTGTVAAHVATIAERDTKLSGLETKVTELTGTVETHVDTIAARDLTISELTGEIASNAVVLAEAKALIVELNGKITTVDAASDVKAREIAARHGIELPPKAPGAGDKTTENADKPALTGMAKARAYFAGRLPEPKN